MNFGEALKELEGQRDLLAIIDEMLHYAEKIKGGEVDVPGATIHDKVDLEYTTVVMDRLNVLRGEVAEQITKLENVEVQFDVRRVRPPPKKEATRRKRVARPRKRKKPDG